MEYKASGKPLLVQAYFFMEVVQEDRVMKN